MKLSKHVFQQRVACLRPWATSMVKNSQDRVAGSGARSHGESHVGIVVVYIQEIHFQCGCSQGQLWGQTSLTGFVVNAHPVFDICGFGGFLG